MTGSRSVMCTDENFFQHSRRVFFRVSRAVSKPFRVKTGVGFIPNIALLLIGRRGIRDNPC